MKRRRISDREIRDEILHFSRYGTVGECLTELLRCRRALRKIHRLATEEPGWFAVGIECIAAKALGKGEKS